MKGFEGDCQNFQFNSLNRKPVKIIEQSRIVQSDDHIFLLAVGLDF